MYLNLEIDLFMNEFALIFVFIQVQSHVYSCHIVQFFIFYFFFFSVENNKILCAKSKCFYRWRETNIMSDG